MAEESYAPGSLSALITQKSKKGKSEEKKVKTKKTKLDRMFDDPTSAEYELTTFVEDSESEPEPLPDPTEVRRKEVREKSKLVKMRQREKIETGSRTVFVGNVPIDAEKKDIMKFFMKYGKIESIRFRNFMRKDLTKPLKASAIIKDVHPLCKSINAYIVFQEEKSATRALKRNGKELLGSHLRVDLASSASEREPNRKCSIFVGNAPFDANEEALRKHFSACGDIVNVRLIRDKETRLGKGFGYVEFKSPDGVSLALQMDGQKFGKNKLRVQRCLKNTRKTEAERSQQQKSWAGSTADRQKKFKSKDKKTFDGKRPKKPKQKVKSTGNNSRGMNKFGGKAKISSGKRATQSK